MEQCHSKNSKPTNNAKQPEYEQHPVQDQQWTRLELRQGYPSYSTKARCSQPKQSIQPTARFLTPFTPHEALGSHAFFSRDLKIRLEQSPRVLHATGEHQHWAQDTQPGCHRSRGKHTSHPPLPSSHLSLQATLHTVLFPVHPIPLTDKPHTRVQTHPPAMQRQQPLRSSSSSWWEHETIRAIKKGMQRKSLCIPLPTSSPRGPAGSQGSASQWTQRLFTAVEESCVPSPPTRTYILGFRFPSPRKAAYGGREKWIISTLHIIRDVLTCSVSQFIH